MLRYTVIQSYDVQVFQIIEATAEVARLADTAAVLVAARGRLLAGLGGNMTLQEARLAEYEVRGHVSRVTCLHHTLLAAGSGGGRGQCRGGRGDGGLGHQLGLPTVSLLRHHGAHHHRYLCSDQGLSLQLVAISRLRQHRPRHILRPAVLPPVRHHRYLLIYNPLSSI